MTDEAPVEVGPVLVVHLQGRREQRVADGQGCLLAQGKFFRFPHRDLGALESRLRQLDPEAGKLVVVDGVFSMEGDIVKLPQVRSLCDRFKARLYVDEAHGLGVIGATGRGGTRRAESAST